MGTVDDVISIAKSQLGVKESPPNSNSVLYNDWYYGRHVEGSDYPWCMVFVQWVFNKANVPLPLRTASCSALMFAAKKSEQFVTSGYLKGDVLLYSFASSKTPTHCGIMVGYDSSTKKYSAIEGNTSNTNEDNGGEVMLKSRSASSIVGAVRPKFTTVVEEDDETMDASKLTEKEAYEILTKAMAYADKLPEPSWSIQNGSWKDAMAKGIITDNTPEGLVRRDQLTTVLKRLGLV